MMCFSATDILSGYFKPFVPADPAEIGGDILVFDLIMKDVFSEVENTVDKKVICHIGITLSATPDDQPSDTTVLKGM